MLITHQRNADRQRYNFNYSAIHGSNCNNTQQNQFCIKDNARIYIE